MNRHTAALIGTLVALPAGALALCPGPPGRALAAAVLVTGLICSTLTLTALHREDTMTSDPSPTATNRLRARAERLRHLGILASYEVETDADGRAVRYVFVTAGGEVADVPRRDVPMYLHGLAQGHYAAKHPRERSNA